MKNVKKIEEKSTRFLTVSLVFVSILCVSIFSFLAIYMNKQSRNTIGEVGTIYMTGMSEQISMHFETAMELRLSQVEALAESLIPGSSVDEHAIRDSLDYSAKARGFSYLAFYSSDGVFDMIYGAPVEVATPDPFLTSLKEGSNKVASGSDSAGNRIVLLGVPIRHDDDCVALVAALPIDYIKDTLALDEDNALVYSYVIRRDGSFVVRSSDAFRESYFERIRAVYQPLNGKTPDQYIAELETAMAMDLDYSSVIQINGSLRHMYCTSLPYSEWYLVSIMSYGTLSDTVDHMGRQWLFAVLIGCAVILLALLLVFGEYFKITRQQIQALEEARLAAISANKAKSEFLSNVSHDIRTPMNAIVGMTAIATANIDNRQQVQNCLKKIALSSKHLLGLINDVLDMSKIESGKMTLNMDLISLREVMDSIVGIVQPQIKAKRQSFDVFIHDISSENVYCDSVRLNQVMLNFLSNAIKFTPEEGSVHVALFQEPSPAGETYVRTHILVTDTGIGMTPEFIEKIYESFTREDSARVHKTEGTGLGMTITKYIVDAMGGTIQVQSQPGKGTEFHVTLDLERAPTQEIDMVLPEWNMLVVDDDEQLCLGVVDSLKSIGVKAEWVLDGESALELVDKSHQRHDDYQIILLDWKLPGMDGIEAARAIRKRMGSDIPILLISAYDWSDIEDDAREAGVSGFISKPLFKSTLFHCLKQYTDSVALPSDHALSAEPDLTGRRILLAEDNDLNWEIAEALLSDLGLNLTWAQNGQICVEKFRQSPVGYYDAVLMDIRMPVMTGYEATRAIRAMAREDADIPIIAMTADAFSEDIKKCLECGMNAHIAKPIDTREIMRLLEKYIK